ncbi:MULTISPECIES: hypothetical protein [Nocardiaceae]|uniref:hypothetical protein n=1 Tax=Nocardiaceae TaxID=85025 RepID=UPI00055E8E97|nr:MULTISPECIES: hypothetical protein [Rhodococcus]OZD12016.1 hypothetical protein CH248_28830 [Rhodococcus sp. 06-156-4a]OZD15781.1 hypothetical protein CH253_22710 [Rhodococcus sp. 06-156-3C]OZD21165.1 hypothetical protein CH280_02940 [Rhodococcus sp. 06-156-4C]OZD32347.1 hypothetical protein CH284_20870 [Rhodococcus sp. 06-156-3]OZD36569.1 hypothetical protein CH247_03295 [Rhodococcus sp. 06-156-3b]
MTGERDTSLRGLAKYLAGPAEIAAALGVEANTINVWKVRHARFPKPVRRLKSGDVWDIRDIEAWAHATQRTFTPAAGDIPRSAGSE